MSDEVIHLRTGRGAREIGGRAQQLARGTGNGSLVRIRHGGYADKAEVIGIDDRTRHLLLIEATRAAALQEPVFSHESAAALLGIPILGDWPIRARTIVPPKGASSSGAVRRMQRPIAASELLTAESGAVTTGLARTAIELAADRTLLSGIVAISHVRQAGVPLDALRAAIEALGPIRGISRARRALERSTAGSESVLETLVVVRCQDYGFEVPEQQRMVTGADGMEYRVDFAWQGGRILGEADGRGKYFDPALRAGRTAEGVVWDEKRREDALRARCERFVRLVWNDAWRGVELAKRLREAGVPNKGRRLCALTF